MRITLPVALLVSIISLGAPPLRAQGTEALWYSTNDEASVRSFLAHADRVSIIAPQAFALDSMGVVTGRIDPRVLARTRR
jgi:hypothetical protein